MTPSETQTAPPAPEATDPRAQASPTQTLPVVLSVQGLSVWYGASLALRDIAIDIPRNRITAMIGPSGCGKSTLLRCFNRMNDLIAGFRMAGTITFDGESISDADTDPVAL